MQHTAHEDDVTILGCLSRIFPNSSKNTLRIMLTKGRVLVDDVVIYRAKHEVSPGQIIVISDKPKAEEDYRLKKKQRKQSKLEILWEDDTILVLNKPAGLLSVASNKMEDDTLHSWANEHVKKRNPKSWCYIVHRLDKETSGVMVMAKSEKAKEHLQEQFAQRSLHRIYNALIEGRPQESQGTVRSFLVEDKHLNVRGVSSTYKGAKEAITHWKIEDSDEHVSLVELYIETGRRHQIRMAMQYIGCPVVGDKLHGAESDPLGRIALHATALEFLHPEHDDPVRFEAKIPFAP